MKIEGTIEVYFEDVELYKKFVEGQKELNEWLKEIISLLMEKENANK